MGFNREDELPFFKGNYVAVPGRIVRYNSSSERLPNLNEAALDSENVGKAESRADVVDSYQQREYEPRLKNVSYDPPAPIVPMLITVKTDNSGTTSNDQYRLRIFDGPVDVDWGDGTSDTGVTGVLIHTYPSAGTYQISIGTRSPAQVRNANFGDIEKLISIDQWGTFPWNSMQAAFYGCTNLVINATDAPDLSRVSTMLSAFRNCLSITAFPTDWDLSGVENFTSAWEGTPNMLSGFESYDLTGATSLENAWFQYSPRVGIESWGCTTSTNLVNVRGAWYQCDLSKCSGGTGVFPYFEMSNVTNVSVAWLITAISNLDENLDWSSVEDSSYAFLGAGFLGFSGEIFPDFDYSSVINARNMFDRTANINFGGTFPKFPILENGTEMFLFGSATVLSAVYDDMLVWYDANNSNSNVPFYAGNSAKYTPAPSAAATARDNLLARGWTITDGGPI